MTIKDAHSELMFRIAGVIRSGKKLVRGEGGEVAPRDIVLPVPPSGEDEQDWDEKAETAKKAWELGRRTMVPKPLRPIPGSRLTLRRAFPQTD